MRYQLSLVDWQSSNFMTGGAPSEWQYNKSGLKRGTAGRLTVRGYKFYANSNDARTQVSCAKNKTVTHNKKIKCHRFAIHNSQILIFKIKIASKILEVHEFYVNSKLN